MLIHEVDGLDEAERFVNVSADGKVVDGDLREGGREGGEGGGRRRMNRRDGRKEGREGREGGKREGGREGGGREGYGQYKKVTKYT